MLDENGIKVSFERAEFSKMSLIPNKHTPKFNLKKKKIMTWQVFTDLNPTPGAFENGR